MHTDIPHVLPAERVFRLRRSAGLHSALWLAGGGAALGFAAVGLVVALLIRVDQISLHAITTLPILIGLGALFSAWSIARSPREVKVGSAGVEVQYRQESKTYGWEEIGWSTIQRGGGMGMRRQVTLYGTAGQTLARLSDALDGFDELAASIAAQVAARQDETSNRDQLSKSKRNALFVGIVGLVMMVVAVSVAWMTYTGIRDEARLNQTGEPGLATIEERFLAPNGVTPRLVYRVTLPDGRSATRNAEIMRHVWDQLEGAATIPVIHAPDDPSNSRLLFGEVPDRDMFKQPLIGYGLPALVALISLFCLVGACLMWRGWDIDLDSKTGRISIKRFGTGR